MCVSNYTQNKMKPTKNEILERLGRINEEISSLNKLLKKYAKGNNESFRCEKCNSSFVYIRRKDKKLLCRKCGSIQDIKIDEIEND